MISTNKNNFKIILAFFTMVVALVLLVISSIYFSRLTWNTNISTEYWLRYMWLCFIIISSASFIGSTLILSKYFAKIIEYRLSKKNTKNKKQNKG